FLSWLPPELSHAKNSAAFVQDVRLCRRKAECHAVEDPDSTCHDGTDGIVALVLGACSGWLSSLQLTDRFRVCSSSPLFSCWTERSSWLFRPHRPWPVRSPRKVSPFFSGRRRDRIPP